MKINRAVALFLLLFGCATQTDYITPEGLELYQCGNQKCLEVVINGQVTECIYDTAAEGSLWLSDRSADDMGLIKGQRFAKRLSPRSKLWTYATENRYGPGTVDVSLRSVVTACVQRNGEEDCQEVYPYSTAINGASCLWGLG